MKQWWWKLTVTRPAEFGDWLWLMLVVRMAEFLDQLTFRHTIVLIGVALIVMGTADLLGPHLSAAFAADITFYLDVFTAVMFAGAQTRAYAIAQSTRRLLQVAARRAIHIATSFRASVRQRRTRKVARQLAKPDSDEPHAANVWYRDQFAVA